MTKLNKTQTTIRTTIAAAITAQHSQKSAGVQAPMHKLRDSDACIVAYAKLCKPDVADLLVRSREMAKRAHGAATGRMDGALSKLVDHIAANPTRDQYSLPQSQAIMVHSTTTQSYYARLFLQAIGSLKGRIPAVEDRAAGFTIDRESDGMKWLLSL